jgi:hypothetical protein
MAEAGSKAWILNFQERREREPRPRPCVDLGSDTTVYLVSALSLSANDSLLAPDHVPKAVIQNGLMGRYSGKKKDWGGARAGGGVWVQVEGASGR